MPKIHSNLTINQRRELIQLLRTVEGFFGGDDDRQAQAVMRKCAKVREICILPARVTAPEE